MNNKISQLQIAEYLIDVKGYSQEDINDFNDVTSIYHNRLQDLLTDSDINELIKYIK